MRRECHVLITLLTAPRRMRCDCIQEHHGLRMATLATAAPQRKPPPKQNEKGNNRKREENREDIGLESFEF